MKDLERRLRLLEGGNRLGACIECECERLNTHVSGAPWQTSTCHHEPRFALLDALRGLNSLEQKHVNS
jgi:hypothetical protein